MPELPEVETVVSELHRQLKGRTIKSVSVLLPKLVFLGPRTVSNVRRNNKKRAAAFAAKLKGQRIRAVKRRAKIIIIEFYSPKSRLPGKESQRILLVHLKMTGQFIFFKKSELNKKVRIINRVEAPLYQMPCKYTHVIFTFSDGAKLFYNDLRQFGYFRLVDADELARVKELKEFGPEPLDKNFTFQVFEEILKKRPNAKIKQALTEPKLIAGIGNIYSDEILFRAKVRPLRRIKTLSRAERRAIFRAIPFILKKAIRARGSSVGDFIRPDGSWGTMGKYHFVYGRAGQSCKKCGVVITSAKIGGRTASFCLRCQR